jgi:hypothetical protein
MKRRELEKNKRNIGKTWRRVKNTDTEHACNEILVCQYLVKVEGKKK